MKKGLVTIAALGALVLVGSGVLTGCATGSSGYTTNSNSTSNASGSSAAGGSSNTQNGTNPWLTVNNNTKSVTLKLVASENEDNNGFNFDGNSNGAMQVTVPLNWTVNVVFQNDSQDMPHSAMIVPLDQRSMTGGFTPAFSGAFTPNAGQGTMNGVTQTFSFNASKDGTYAIICAVPGHSANGFWDTLVVSSNATIPAMTVTTNTSTSSSSSGWY